MHPCSDLLIESYSDLGPGKRNTFFESLANIREENRRLLFSFYFFFFVLFINCFLYQYWNVTCPVISSLFCILAGPLLSNDQDNCIEVSLEETEVNILESSDESDKTSKVWNFHFHIVNSKISAVSNL